MGGHVKSFRSVVAAVLCVSFINCASSFTSNLEEAKFDLDQGNFDAAINSAAQALNANPQNVEAARLLASAYFGRSGLDFLDLAEAIIDLDRNDSTAYQQIAAALPTSANMDDVRAAVSTLQSLDGIDTAGLDNDIADAAFDLGLMEAIEHFALGVYGANFFTSLDTSQISSASKDLVQANTITFDNHLVNAGVESTETYVMDIRHTFCVLEPISSGEGFTLAEYQAFVGCQLTPDPDTFDTTAFTADIANCAVINPDDQPADVQTCYAQDTAL